MRKANHMVFDDYIAPHSPAFAVFTKTELNAKLGEFDQLAVMVIVDNVVDATGAFNLWVAHSADDRNWVYRNGSPPSTRPTNGDAQVTGLSTSAASNPGVYMDGGATPFLGFLRFELAFSSTTNGGHVRVYVTQRDQG